MATILVQIQVKDFAEWKKVFETGDQLRKSNGELSHLIYHDVSDPHQVFAIYKWDAPANGQKFFQSQELKDIMMKAGVMGAPSVHFLNEA